MLNLRIKKIEKNYQNIIIPNIPKLVNSEKNILKCNKIVEKIIKIIMETVMNFPISHVNAKF